MSEPSTNTNESSSSTTKEPITTRKQAGKLKKIADEVLTNQLNLTEPPKKPEEENADTENVDSSDSDTSEGEPHILRLADTELKIELAKNKNMHDEMALLKARLNFKELMGDESWGETLTKTGQNTGNSLQKLVNKECVDLTQSVPSMSRFKPLQTSSRENTSFRSSVETKQTISQHVWFEGSIQNKELREELSEYAVDTLDGIIDWFKDGGNLVGKLLASGGEIWKTWVSKLIQLKLKVKKLLTRYENNKEILEELTLIFEAMEFWYSHINSEAELKGTFQFIASWAEEAKTKQIMGSNMANDFKRALSVSRNDQREKFVHQKSTLQLRTMNSSADWRSQKSNNYSSSSSSSYPRKDHYKSRDSYKRKDYGSKDYGSRDRSRDYNRRSYPDKRDQRRNTDRREGGGQKNPGENTLPVKQF